MPVAHRYGVQMRCCGDKGLVGYPITKSTLNGRVHGVTLSVLKHGITGLGCLLKSVVSVDSDTEGLVAAAQREEQQMQSANFPVVFMSLAKDLRQRKDCECTRSTDIGQYTLQCPHGCRLATRCLLLRESIGEEKGAS
eukprot:Skav212571  [mRNA]  locus=scaffold125:234520:237192:- [translate_table: standard]